MKKILLSIILTTFIAFAFSKAIGQDRMDTVNFRAIDAVTSKPVELAHVINLTQREVAISDLLGYFKLPLKIGDTISITSLGYFKQDLINWGQYGRDSMYFTIRLKPRSYDLKELKFSWFSNYERFLKGFLQLQLPITKEDRDIARVNDYFSRTIKSLDLMSLPQSASGAAFGRDWLAKQNQQLKIKLEKERIQRLIERKYSAGIVEAITGLKGNEVFWFMGYCAFTNEFLLQSSDYEIRLRILDKFKIYNQDKGEKDQK